MKGCKISVWEDFEKSIILFLIPLKASKIFLLERFDSNLKLKQTKYIWQICISSVINKFLLLFFLSPSTSCFYLRHISIGFNKFSNFSFGYFLRWKHFGETKLRSKYILQNIYLIRKSRFKLLRNRKSHLESNPVPIHASSFNNLPACQPIGRIEYILHLKHFLRNITYLETKLKKFHIMRKKDLKHIAIRRSPQSEHWKQTDLEIATKRPKKSNSL